MYSWIPTTEQMFLLSHAQRRYVLAQILLDPPPNFEWLYSELGGPSHKIGEGTGFSYVEYEEGWYGTAGCAIGWTRSLWPDLDRGRGLCDIWGEIGHYAMMRAEPFPRKPTEDITRQDVAQLMLKGTGAE